MKEVKILMTLKHPNINEIYGTEEEDRFIHIFLQLCTGGDLFTYVSTANMRNHRLCEAEAKYIMFQLLKALEYLHNRHIAHRGKLTFQFGNAPICLDLDDLPLQPENILLYAPGPYPRVLIADFGLARPNSYQETLNVCGTVSYLPPEGILALDNKHLGYVGMPADCWSAGVILYVMMSGCHPFDNGTPDSYWEESEYGSQLEEDMREESYHKPSQMEAQARLKTRIVQGHVEFPYYPWNSLREG
ncbi:hypothetical protein D9611_005745 [Ephemerocybe angulata]|uniref:Protein kinase domain-containing protein n=1 Tax=Ephemerocybe angulata TaxID=980116 RepID=A0A8H5F4F1_9AGAR|nr:hypothetical protein D9611_005745 [Tulosesus angulatus]